jgi:hypothetical protein
MYVSYDKVRMVNAPEWDASALGKSQIIGISGLWLVVCCTCFWIIMATDIVDLDPSLDHSNELLISHD